MKRLIAIAALLVAFPALSNDRDYKIENMIAGLFACYWYYADSGEDDIANHFRKEHGYMASSYALYLGDRYKYKSASVEVNRLSIEYPDRYDMKSLCSKAHDSLIKPKL